MRGFDGAIETRVGEIGFELANEGAVVYARIAQ